MREHPENKLGAQPRCKLCATTHDNPICQICGRDVRDVERRVPGLTLSNGRRVLLDGTPLDEQERPS